MNYHAIYHRPKQNYAYAYDQKTIHLRVRTAKDEIETAKVIFGDPYHWVTGGGGGNLNAEGASGWISETVDMKKEASTDLFDFWIAEVSPKFRRMRYAFILESDKERILFGEKKIVNLSDQLKDTEVSETKTHFENLGNFFCFPFLNGIDVFKAPEWIKDTIWYQIFPERFANGDDSITPENAVEWGSVDPKYDTFYGGDLQGVIDHLDYLQKLGINGIYFCPIFKSPSTHKYDTTNYFEIDPQFGTKETFKKLVELAHERGIRIMLDAVFNHCGWYFPQWQDVVKNEEQSEYKDWFHIRKFPLIEEDFDPIKQPGGLNFDTFAFGARMPKLNTENPEVIDYFLEVGRYWVREFDIDGWRLDVANEVDHAFWREFRKAVREIKEDVYILGEIWHDSQPWLNGDQFDAVMNYPLTDAVLDFIARESIKPSEFKIAINKIYTNYSHNVNEVAFNLLDSHDTTRLLTLCKRNKQKALLAYIIQMTQTGAPCIYYGGEIGLDGGADPLCRKCMIWDEEEQDLELFNPLKKLIEIRKNHSAMRAHELQWIVTNDKNNTLIFKKVSEEEEIYVLLNNHKKSQTLNIPSHMQQSCIDLMNNQPLELKNSITLAPYSALLLTPVK